MIKPCYLNSQKMPWVLGSKSGRANSNELFDLATTHCKLFRERLLQHGAILFRGFDLRETEEFEKFVRLFSGKNFFNYAGGVSPRLSLSRGVYTSTQYPPNLKLNLHNELSYSKSYPEHLYFFCQTAPASGGETTLGDSRRILRNIRPKITGLFKHKKISYKRLLHPHRGSGYSWQDAFETDDRNEIEDACRRAEIEYEWLQNDCLRLSQKRPATVTHPETSEEVWFNQADGFHSSNLDVETRQALIKNGEEPRLNCLFGDDSEMCELMLKHVRSVLHQETIPLRWQAGDVLVLDNVLAAHGRMPFQGARKIILAMT